MGNVKLYICLVAGLLAEICFGKPYEKVILKNGTELEGYISVQYPGKKIVFSAEKAMVYLSSDKVHSIVEHECEVSSLSATWKNWARQNTSFLKKIDGKSYLTLSDLVLKKEQNTADTVLVDDSVKQMDIEPDLGVAPHNVKLMEKGAVIKYLDLSSVSYDIAWSDILMIKREPRSALCLTGIKDIIELASGQKLVGQIIEQIPGKYIRLLGDEGLVEVVEQHQIRVQKKSKLNPDFSLFEQSPWLEIIRTKQGDEIKGVIVEQLYGNNGSLRIEMENGEIVEKNSLDVVEIRKILNPAYSPLEDILVKDSEIWVNRHLLEKVVIDQEEGVLIINEQSAPFVLYADSIHGKLVVEQQNNKENQSAILLKLVTAKVKKKDMCVFTYEDLLTRGLQPIETMVSVNNTLKFVYSVEAGNYILYRPQTKEGFYVQIK